MLAIFQSATAGLESPKLSSGPSGGATQGFAQCLSAAADETLPGAKPAGAPDGYGNNTTKTLPRPDDKKPAATADLLNNFIAALPVVPIAAKAQVGPTGNAKSQGSSASGKPVVVPAGTQPAFCATDTGKAGLLHTEFVKSSQPGFPDASLSLPKSNELSPARPTLPFRGDGTSNGMAHQPDGTSVSLNNSLNKPDPPARPGELREFAPAPQPGQAPEAAPLQVDEHQPASPAMNANSAPPAVPGLTDATPLASVEGTPETDPASAPAPASTFISIKGFFAADRTNGAAATPTRPASPARPEPATAVMQGSTQPAQSQPAPARGESVPAGNHNLTNTTHLDADGKPWLKRAPAALLLETPRPPAVETLGVASQKPGHQAPGLPASGANNFKTAANMNSVDSPPASGEKTGGRSASSTSDMGNGGADRGLTKSTAANTPAQPGSVISQNHDTGAGEALPVANSAPQLAGQPVAEKNQTPGPSLKLVSETRAAEAVPLQSMQPVQVHAARLFQNGAQAEMRVGLRTEVFGGVDVRATVSGKQVQIELGSERGDLHGVLASELPTLQNSLQQHDLRLELVRNLNQAATAQQDFSSGSGRQHRFQRPEGTPPAAGSRSEAPEAAVLTDSATSLDIHV